MAIMQWNSQTGNYEARLTDGSTLIVDGDIYAEQAQAGVDPRELEQSATWENCLDGERVFIEGNDKQAHILNPHRWMGRPSNGRTAKVEATVTPELRQWLNRQQHADESISTVIFRLLDGLRQAEHNS